MWRYLAASLLWLSLGAPLQCASGTVDAGRTYTLLSRSSPTSVHPVLTPTQRQWLGTRRELVLGTSAPDYPPFDISTGGREYQGLTADYAGLIGNALGLPVRIRRFPSRPAAVAALKNGHIDMLGSANGYEATTQGLALSRPYAIDQPVLVTREDETRALDTGLEGMRLSMLYHYLPTEEIRTNYPKAELLTFESSTQALNAVAFEQADVFIGDTVSTHYLISQGHLPHLRMANFGKHEAVGFSFALREDEQTLLTLVDAALDAQSTATRNDIFKRWSASSGNLLTDRKLQLSPREESWLRDNPVMRVVVNETAAPLTYFDNNGRLRGIVADLLELIRLRTGLRFEIRRASGDGDMVDQLESGRADIIASLSIDTRRGSTLQVSRPYLESAYVLVSHTGADQPSSLKQLKGKRVAIPRDSTVAALLTAQHPRIHQVATESTYYSMALLGSGAVDAVIATLIDANHMVAAANDLVIRSTVGTEPATFSMATRPKAGELASILDKALLSVSPEELGVINSRWRDHGLREDAYWRSYRRIILQVVGVIGVLLVLALVWNARLRRQIKQRQRAERALNDQLEFMGALLNGTPHPMYVRDREGRLKSCNESYLLAVGATLEQVMGKRLEDSQFSDRDYTRQVQDDYRRVMEEGRPLILDRPLRLKDKELTIYHWILPYRDSLGEMQGIIGGWIDISERRNLVQDLRLAKQQADDANRAKSVFLATISHEIRTPMNALIGMLELALKRAEQGQLDRPALEVAHHSARDLLGLIGDILDIARIESGHLSLAPEPVDLAALIESVGRVFDGLARHKGLTLDVTISPEARCHAMLDPLRFKQVLSNLVSNAIKFTEQGQVHITAKLHTGGEPTLTTLDLEVRDTGIGIHEQDQQRLFSPFVQANPYSDGARAGTGLGLVISRNLCAMMGGELTLQSLQGVGTRVRLVMPLQRVDPVDSPLPASTGIERPDTRLRILVIDDHPANLLLMAQQLGYLGLRQESASDGREGLRKWREGCFDVLVVDCNMPQMNGYELARTVRAEERLQGRPRCAMLGYTANAQPEIRQQCLDAGMDDCLLKPIGLQMLGQRLAAITGLSRQCIGRNPPRHRFDLEGLTAIVGDSVVDRNRILSTLHLSLRQDLEILMAIDPEHDANELAAHAHKILSAARMLDARMLIQACEALEATGLTLAELKTRRQALARHMRRVEQALARQLDNLAEAG
ncbi:transporter substrate-binding domain-containing protein [Pseudomonas sp. GD03858]|uniref:transporter substrate-binding domain-containing protein n=1 Tax=unclassified Pseudomonas TaxID=196821 RepID=UPI00244D00C3|nr:MULTISPECIES: transporter substrate-binding domain-containing protein [unclassified Pseudomonas]MDH0647345.1 transporter substrate-binding domain-containing protein [Pseudomonas sp. GD03867]MDH0664513.1 transporter substrate-binding domain-containing protein [Pseudomonas sp. GD03858]